MDWDSPTSRAKARHVLRSHLAAELAARGADAVYSCVPEVLAEIVDKADCVALGKRHSHAAPRVLVRRQDGVLSFTKTDFYREAHRVLLPDVDAEMRAFAEEGVGVRARDADGKDLEVAVRYTKSGVQYELVPRTSGRPVTVEIDECSDLVIGAQAFLRELHRPVCGLSFDGQKDVSAFDAMGSRKTFACSRGARAAYSKISKSFRAVGKLLDSDAARDQKLSKLKQLKPV